MKTILHIEDNVANRVLVERVLVQAGYRVIQASDGESGLRAAEESSPDLILIDMGLPDIDGQTVATLLRLSPTFTATPIVAITGWPEDKAMEIARRYGLSGCIVKPIEVSDFPKQIADFIKTTK